MLFDSCGTKVIRHKFLVVRTRYWKPNDDYVNEIVRALKGKIREGDIVVVSEKAVSTATNNIVDESRVEPSFTAWFLSRFWMRYVWAYVLGPISNTRKKTILHFKNYPIREGSAHKQVVLQHCGFLQALAHGSEGGIDGSNLPYSYVSLPLEEAPRAVKTIRSCLKERLSVDVAVMIADTDKTYSWRNFHFSPRSGTISGIRSIRGVAGYVLGRVLRFKKRATPLAISGTRMSVQEALDIAELASRARGFGAGRTVWEMAGNLDVSLTDVTWEMLEKAKHTPLIVVRYR